MALVNLSKIAKIVNNLEYGILFLKKGLEYAWYSNDEQLEIKIYDWIGMIYF